MINRELNFGRSVITEFVTKAMPFTNVLDVGAGGGFDLDIVKGINPSAKFHAIDCYEPDFPILKRKGYLLSSINIEKDSMPYDDNSMELVIANQILEHTKELFWIMHEISRVLSVGGKVIIGLPNLASLHNRVLLAFGQQPTSIKSHSAHVRGFTKNDVLTFCETCFPGGYKLINFRGSNFYPFPGWAAQLLSKIAPNMAWGIFFMFEKTKPYNGEFIHYLEQTLLQSNFYQGKI